MPNYKKHLLGGFVTYSTLLLLLRSVNPTLINLIQWLSICLFGSLFPDVDTKSKIQKIFYISFLIVLIFLFFSKKIKLALFLSMIGFSPLVVNHRGIFHKAWFLVLITIAFLIFSVEIKLCKSCFDFAIPALFFISGAISHIVLDMGVKQLFRI